MLFAASIVYSLPCVGLLICAFRTNRQMRELTAKGIPLVEAHQRSARNSTIPLAWLFVGIAGWCAVLWLFGVLASSPSDIHSYLRRFAGPNVAIFLALGSIWFWIAAKRGSIVGFDLTCARCGYPSGGVIGSTCSECGRIIAFRSDVRTGRIEPERRVIPVAIVASVLAVAFVVPKFTPALGFSVVSLTPTSGLIARTASPSRTESDAAWTELSRRQITIAQRRRLLLLSLQRIENDQIPFLPLEVGMQNFILNELTSGLSLDPEAMDLLARVQPELRRHAMVPGLSAAVDAIPLSHDQMDRLVVKAIEAVRQSEDVGYIAELDWLIARANEGRLSTERLTEVLALFRELAHLPFIEHEASRARWALFLNSPSRPVQQLAIDAILDAIPHGERPALYLNADALIDAFVAGRVDEHDMTRVLRAHDIGSYLYKARQRADYQRAYVPVLVLLDENPRAFRDAHGDVWHRLLRDRQEGVLAPEQNAIFDRSWRVYEEGRQNASTP